MKHLSDYINEQLEIDESVTTIEPSWFKVAFPLARALKDGYFEFSKTLYPREGDGKKYLCTAENYIKLFDPAVTGIKDEKDFNKLVDFMKRLKGWTVKYETDKDGLMDAGSRGWKVL